MRGQKLQRNNKVIQKGYRATIRKKQVEHGQIKKKPLIGIKKIREKDPGARPITTLGIR